MVDVVKKQMKIAIGIAVLVVLVVSAWVVLDSIFISDPRGAGGSSAGTEVATWPSSEEWVLDEALTCDWINGYNDHGPLVTEFEIYETVYAYMEIHGPDMYGKTMRQEWWYKELGDLEFTKRWEWESTCIYHYVKWATWTWWQIGGTYGSGEGFIAVFLDNVFFGTTNLYNIVVGDVLGSIVFDQSTFYEGPFDSGTFQLIAITWCENIGTDAGTIYIKKFIDGMETDSFSFGNRQPGVTWSCCNFYWTIPENTFTAGIKVWGEAESEPQWGNQNTHQWNIQVTSPIPDIGITYTMTILTFPSGCDVTLSGFATMNSGDDGVALFEDVPYGSYAVTVSKVGYPTFTETVFMNDDVVISTDLNSQRYLMPILFLVIVGIAVGLVVYWYKKKI